MAGRERVVFHPVPGSFFRETGLIESPWGHIRGALGGCAAERYNDEFAPFKVGFEHLAILGDHPDRQRHERAPQPQGLKYEVVELLDLI